MLSSLLFSKAFRSIDGKKRKIERNLQGCDILDGMINVKVCEEEKKARDKWEDKKRKNKSN